jgi:hypothetical protein
MAHKLWPVGSFSIKLLSSGVLARRTTQISIDLRIDIPEPGCSESEQPIWFLFLDLNPSLNKMKTNASPEPATPTPPATPPTYPRPETPPPPEEPSPPATPYDSGKLLEFAGQR